ncbi:MAG: 4Fe-4S ferredoxin, partial [Bacteroidota bacterium]
ILTAEQDGSLKIIYNSNLISINPETILMKVAGDVEVRQIPNDLVYIFIGGELPTKFLQSAGVEITKRFGYVVKKHK